jgi:glyoxylase-like metal-dependent hydrolase (beta-lactamase superfamily II)
MAQVVTAMLVVVLGVAATGSRGQTAVWDVHAVRFATLPAFRVASLVAGADRARTLDIAMMVWVVRAPGRIVLVDAGFHRDKFLQQWKPADYQRPSEALRAALGVAPDQVTDIILSHVHWDHADGIDLFPRARVWIQRDEYAHHVDAQGGLRDRAIDPVVASLLHEINGHGRLVLVDGDDREIAPGLRVYTGGRHTFASQYVGVATRRGTVVLASDNAYLYENFDRKAAIAQTLDPAANLAAQARMLTLAGSLARIVPGHDPAVFERFPLLQPGVARID